MRKCFKGLSLTLVTNDECESMMTRRAMSGALVIDNNGQDARFTEAAPKRVRTRNTKVWDGELLSLVVKADGVYQIHTKAVNPMAVESFPQRMFNEACAVLQKMEGR